MEEYTAFDPEYPDEENEVTVEDEQCYEVYG